MSTTGPVAILSAIPQELALLADSLVDADESQLAGQFVVSGSLDGVGVVLAEAGIGKVNTAVVTTLLMERFRPRLVVFTGVAGGLHPGLGIGDVVVAERTIQHDTGVLGETGLQRYQPGHMPFFNPTDRFGFPAQPELLERVRARLVGFELSSLSREAGGGKNPSQVVFGTVLSGDQFLNSETHRRLLHAELGGAAVEMEGAALAQTAEALGVDHLVIRSLTDLAGSESTIDFGRFLHEVAANSARVVRHLLPVL
ncbi:MAG: 5'-methylthioadenosine/adenosylhomocysteine nucleosidase [Acidimicrobiia bacterium]